MSRSPRQLLETVRTIAVVGCSTQPHKAAHRIPAILQAAGYRVIPVHRTASQIL
nr:CoA-binding protein [Euzebyaceae bacterium]